MLKILFHPKSFVFRIFLLGTLCLWVVAHVKVLNTLHQFFKVCHMVLSLSGILVYVCAMIPWYGKKYKGLGIEEHFVNMLVPTTYLIFLYHMIFLIGSPSLFLCVGISCLLMGLLMINFILLFYHFMDRDKTPPAYFSANLYLKHLPKKFAATFLLGLCLLSGTSVAEWRGQNTWSFEDFLVTRPNDRWRIDNHKGTGTMQIKWLQHGEDVVINVRKESGAKRTITPTKRHKKFWLKKFKDTLFTEFENEGFRIVDVNYQEEKILAQAVDKNRRYLLLACVFAKEDYRADYLLISMALNNDQYLKYRYHFLSVVNQTRPANE